MDFEEIQDEVNALPEGSVVMKPGARVIDDKEVGGIEITDGKATLFSTVSIKLEDAN